MSQAMGSDSKNDIKAEATLTELIDNNKKILDSKIDKKIIKQFVKMLKGNKNEKFVHLLQALVVCNGEAVLKNQTEASRMIFEDKEMCECLIMPMRINEEQLEIFVEEYGDNSVESWMFLSDFHHKSHEDDDGELYNYFASLIHLFSDLCLERNYIAIEALQSVYTYEICYKVISDTNEDFYRLKCSFARLMKTLWIDRQPYQRLNLPRFIILSEEITNKTCEKIITSSAITNSFDDLKAYLLEYFDGLAREGCTKVYMIERNKFTLLALEVTLELARFGFYTDTKELIDLVKPLLVLLNGMKDAITKVQYKEFLSVFKKSSFTGEQRRGTRYKTVFNEAKTSVLLVAGVQKKVVERHKESEETLIVMEFKQRICELMKLIMQIANDLGVRRFLCQYKKGTETIAAGSHIGPSLSSDRNPSMTMRAFAKYQTVKGTIPNTPNTNRLDTEEQMQQLFNQTMWITKITDDDPLDIAKLAPTNLSKILLDLLHYEHEGLINSVFELLYMNHSKQLRLKSVLEQVRLIENLERRDTIMVIEQKIAELRGLAETSENWYQRRKHLGAKNEFERCIQLIKDLESYLMFNESEQDNQENPTHEQIEILGLDDALEMMSESSKSEDLDIRSSTNAINYEFQQILRHLKVHEPLLDIIRFELSLASETKFELKTKLLSQIMKFLARFIYREKVNQELLTGDPRIFFKLIKKHTDIGVEDVLESLFRDNKHLIKQVEIVDKFARRILKLFNNGKDYKNSRLLQALNVLMLYKGKPLKLNQIAITTLLTAREYVADFFGFTEKAQKIRLIKRLGEYDQQVLKEAPNGGVVELPADVDYVVSLIQVIACATEGKMAITESKAQSLFPLS